MAQGKLRGVESALKDVNNIWNIMNRLLTSFIFKVRITSTILPIFIANS